MTDLDLARRIEQVASLGEPLRRDLYAFVRAQPEPVSREQAAQALGIAHHAAKFHLDRLVDDGLLRASYRRPPGRSGPGAGRPAKVYRVVGDVEVSVPSRRYDLAGRLLVRAVATARRTARPLVSTLAELATAEGRAVGSESSPERGRGAAARRLRKALESCGYEPEKNGRDLVLHNCPFHQLAEEDRDLVCNMNVAFVQGVCDGTGSRGDARLDPLPGGCCVRVVKP